MAHTYWDPKGMVKKRPGGYTYHGGNTNLSTSYKERYVPYYEPKTTLSNTERTSTLSEFNKSCNWNTYQKRTWYQNHLDHTREEFEEFPGVHAEWRNPEEFLKSSLKYNSRNIYDYGVNVISRDENGVESQRELRSFDHTEVQRLKREAEYNERFDVKAKRTVDFNDIESPPKVTTLNRSSSSSNNSSSNRDIQNFNQGTHGALNSLIGDPSGNWIMIFLLILILILTQLTRSVCLL